MVQFVQKSKSNWLPIALTLVVGVILGWWYLLPDGDDGTLAQIQQRGRLRVGLDASFPPFESMNAAGEIVGLDVEIAQAIAADLGVELVVVNIGFDGLYDALLARRVEVVISGLPYDPRWTEDVAYSHNYFNAGQLLVTRNDQSDIETVTDLANRTVAVEWGSQADMAGRQLSEQVAGLTLLRRATAQEAIEAVSSHQAEAAIVDGVTAVSAEPAGIRLVTYLTDEWYAAAVHIESRQLLQAVNRSLTRLESSGQMAELKARWLKPSP